MSVRVLLTSLLLAHITPTLCFGRLGDSLKEVARELGEAVIAVSKSFDSTERAKELAKCKDDNAACTRWARIGECEKNPVFMHSTCPASCLLCESESCHDKHKECADWALAGECSKNEGFMVRTALPGVDGQCVKSSESCEPIAATAPRMRADRRLWRR